ncbi:MAG TPA: hypothetical protein PLK12_06350 [Prolixibacteraceae bacterium]|nr:hypothetical protein [Prolixibacteraceae bacterium]
MKRTILLIAYVLAFASLFAQYNSENGWKITPSGTYRTLNIFINIIYDITPTANPYPGSNPFWPYTTVEGITTTGPTYFDDYIDVYYTTPANVNGLMTRIYHESSFGRLILLGDMIVVNIKQSTLDPYGGSFRSGELILACNNMINVSGVNTSYGHNQISDYDSNSDNKVDYVQYFCRNGTATYGLDYPDGGFTGEGGNLFFSGVSRQIAFYSFQQAKADQDISQNYKHLSIHEFAHNLFGSNAFHTSGGNHYTWPGSACTFMGLQGGWGLMGAANSSLTSCNAFERWRMNWTSPTFNPGAIRIQANGVTSDIDNTSGQRIFYLRDFVSTGDAIRIRLPYKDGTSSTNQYIWLENHQINNNGKLDFFRWKDEGACIPSGTPGIYAYYQIGKDVLSGTSLAVWPSNETDNLEVISAEGNWDMVFDGNQTDCLGWGNRVVVKQVEENPLSGYNDQMTTLYNSSVNTLLASDHAIYPYVKKYKNNTLNTALPLHGDNSDAFTNNTKIGIATNPAAVNTVTYYANQNGGSITPNYTTKNTRKLYLCGLQILFEVSGSNQFGNIYKVTINWDKYNIDNNLRWTGDIVLKETAILKESKTLLFNQNRTPNQRDRSTTTGEFAEATFFTAENGSYYKMEPGSKVILDENSTFILQNGSTLEIEDGADIIVMNNSKLVVETGASIVVEGRGGITFKCNGQLCASAGASINLQDVSSSIHFVGTGGLSPGCLSSLSSVLSGNGSIRNYIGTTTVSNITINFDSYYSGTTVTSTNVNVQGTGTDLTYSITNGATINGPFNVPAGATFEVKVNSTSCIY